MRATPWTIRYRDGAANVYQLAQAAPSGHVVFEYVPVTPAESSTGTYSGGAPHRAVLPAGDARVDELWRRLERLEVDAAAHAPARAKGTGAFEVETPAGTRAFLVERGAVLDEVHALVRRLRP